MCPGTMQVDSMDSVKITWLTWALLVSVACANLESDYSNYAFLDEAETYKLHWRVDYKEKTIYFAVQVKTLGWVGFGISAGKGNMVGSDVVIGWVKDGTTYLNDRYADAQALPSIDEKQDYIIQSGEEKDGQTILKFKRRLNTCDKRDREIKEGTMRIVYAYHPEDPTSKTSMHRHTKRGARSLILLGTAESKPKLPANIKHFDLRQNDTEIPGKHTSYLCKSFEIEQFPTKQHIVKFDPILTPGNEGLVHHMLLYLCKDDFPRSNLSLVAMCYEDNMPPAITSCAGGTVIAAWGIGGGSFIFPNHVGLAVGAGQGLRYVVLEIHYDNQLKKTGIRDSSGLRFFYSETIRTYDAAILWVGWGVNPSLMIPPKQKSWLTSGYCKSNCTQLGFEDSVLSGGGINVFASFLHSHLQGVALWTKHVRDGKELPEIARDDHYDFNYQEFHFPRKETHIKPGDDLIQVCKYQTMDKTTVTKGGLRSSQEMCMNFMYYYPKVKLSKCVSINYVGGEKELFNRPTAPPLGNASLSNATEAPFVPYEWTPEIAQKLKELYANATDVYYNCPYKPGVKAPIGFKKLPKPVITDPYVKQEDDCPTEESPPDSGAPDTAVSGLFVMIIALITSNLIKT